MKQLCLLAFAFLFTATGCATPKPKPVETPVEVTPPPPVEPPIDRSMTGLKFKVDPADAEVIIDEKSYGPASALGPVKLTPGIYRVAVKAKGYTTWRLEVTVSDRLETVDVSLDKRQ